MWVNDKRRTIRRTAALAIGSVLIAMGATPAQAAPGAPGTAGEPRIVFEERFENASAITILDDYRGPQEWVYPMYTADRGWLPRMGGCNGWVAGSADANPPSDSCSAWDKFRAMAWALGQAQGTSDADSNHAVSELTTAADLTKEAGLMLRTRKNAAKAIPGRFYAASNFVATTSCTDGPQPNLALNLLVNGRPTSLADGLSPCSSKPVVKNGYEVWTKQLYSSAMLIERNEYLGMQMENAATSGGYDGAFDLPQILDVTPQLDHSLHLSGSSLTGNLTYTITNTKDLLVKQGWSFSAGLPGWAKVSGEPVTTCDQGSVQTDGQKVSVTGNLRAGEVSCTVTVPIEVAQGSDTLGPDSITGIKGLDLPGSALLIPDGPQPPSGTPRPEIPGTGSSGSKAGSSANQPAPQAQTGGSTSHSKGVQGLIVGFFLAGIGARVIIHRGVFAR